MSIIYGGAHSVLFIDSNGTKTDSWDNMHLIPASRLAVPIPQPSLSIIKVPGSNKIIDMTEYMSTSMTFESVSGAFEFYVDLDQWSSWDECYVYFKNFFAGKVFSFILADNPTYKYTGRLSAQELKSGANWPTLSISYILTKQAENNDNDFSASQISLGEFSDRGKYRNEPHSHEIVIPGSKYINPETIRSNYNLDLLGCVFTYGVSSWVVIYTTDGSRGPYLSQDNHLPSRYWSVITNNDGTLSVKWIIAPYSSSSSYYPQTASYLAYLGKTSN